MPMTTMEMYYTVMELLLYTMVELVKKTVQHEGMRIRDEIPQYSKIKLKQYHQQCYPIHKIYML